MNMRNPISFEHGPLKIGAAAAANRKATETAIMIMQTGGNAVDATIAAGHLTVSYTHLTLPTKRIV